MFRVKHPDADAVAAQKLSAQPEDVCLVPPKLPKEKQKRRGIIFAGKWSFDSYPECFVVPF